MEVGRPRPSSVRGRFHNPRTSQKARARFARKARKAKAKGKPLGVPNSQHCPKKAAPRSLLD